MQEIPEELKPLYKEREEFMKSVAPKFGMGLTEASFKKYEKLMEELKPIFAKYDAEPIVKLDFKFDNNYPQQKGEITTAIFKGLEIEFKCVIYPEDENGRSAVIKGDSLVKLIEIETKINTRMKEINEAKEVGKNEEKS